MLENQVKIVKFIQHQGFKYHLNSLRARKGGINNEKKFAHISNDHSIFQQ